MLPPIVRFPFAVVSPANIYALPLRNVKSPPLTSSIPFIYALRSKLALLDKSNQPSIYI